MSNELAIQGNNNLITIFLCKQFFICDYKIIKCFLICLKIILSLSLSLFPSLPFFLPNEKCRVIFKRIKGEDSPVVSGKFPRLA